MPTSKRSTEPTPVVAKNFDAATRPARSHTDNTSGPAPRPNSSSAKSTADIDVSVYLNEDDNIWHARRFVPETALLRLAAKFRVELPDDAPSTPIPLLERVFEQLNVGGDLVPAEPWTLRYRLARNRSLSVGDVVVVDGSAYTVARFAWDPITLDQLLAGAERFARIANPNTPAGRALA